MPRTITAGDSARAPGRLPVDASGTLRRVADFDDLLEGLEGEAREARLRLLTALHDEGCTMDELRRAVEEDRLVLLPVDRVFAGEGGRYSRRELAAEAGVDHDVLRDARRAFGLTVSEPDDARVWGEADLAASKGLRTLLDVGVPIERIVEVNRVIGRAMLQVAAATRAMVGEAVVRPGMSEYDVAVSAAAAARELTPQMTPVLEYVYQAHLRELLSSDVISAADIASGRTAGAREMTVAFADLVDFTRLGETVEAEEVGDVVGRLEDVTASLVEKPVTFVKTIGDAVMLVSPRPDPLLDVALRLVEADLPDLRVGVACGPALERAGDWYGSPVNQASRVTDVARPNSVLTTESVHDHVEDRWSWSFAGERKLKGVGPTKLFRARRPDLDGDAGSGLG
jgi:adenylate cyclase